MYGSYAAVRYGNLGKKTICGFIAANQPLVTNCNPDFNTGGLVSSPAGLRRVPRADIQ
jgi:hypothetical protein